MGASAPCIRESCDGEVSPNEYHTGIYGRPVGRCPLCGALRTIGPLPTPKRRRRR